MKTKKNKSWIGDRTPAARTSIKIAIGAYLTLTDQRVSPLGQTNIYTISVLIVHTDNNRKARCVIK